MNGVSSRMSAPDRIVITGALHRRHHVRVKLTDQPPPPKLKGVRRSAHVARMLALAHHLQRALDEGRIANRAELARRLGFTQTRITQVLDLLWLAPDIQDALLHLLAVDGREPVSERALRDVVRIESWDEQRAVWAGIVPRDAATDRPRAVDVARGWSES